MTSEKVIRKLKKGYDDVLKGILLSTFGGVVERIKYAIIEEYDQELVDVVTDRKSKTNPNYYREEFVARLDTFKYITKEQDGITLSVPDMETFDFSGRLRVIQSIMEGLPGLYVEMNEEEYVSVFRKRPLNADPLDETTSPKERIYLVRSNAKVRNAERDRKKKFVKYPFSNTPPIRVLDVAGAYVDRNLDEWIDEALERSQKEFTTMYKGAKL